MTTESKKKILINKSMGQLRVACIDNKKLYVLEIEHADQEQKVDRICNGEVISIEPSLEAAFINFGSERNGFLPLKEVAREYYQVKTADERRSNIGIKDTLFIGQKVLVQVNKEERGTKGAALSTWITLAGCYLVLMPNNPKAGGISKRIENEEREDLRNKLRALNIPKGMGVIARTAAIGKSLEELQWDLNVLVNLWEAIQNASKSHGAPYLIHQESDIVIRTIRDHLRPDIDEIIIDDKENYEKAKAYIERIRPEYESRVKFYEEATPLFSYYQIESQIEAAFQRKVRLPSGGEIVIDRSEALTAIDVNSARATKGMDIEETALKTNLEAAEAIAIQLRIRDLGGLVVIDFIDMEDEKNKVKVENSLQLFFRADRARVQIGRLSKFGLLEMSRQRLRPALNEASQIVCPRCHGQGSIRNIQSQAFSIIHLLEEKAAKESPYQICLQIPVKLATYLINEHRKTIDEIEKSNNTNIIIIPNRYLESPHFEIEAVGKAKAKNRGAQKSYELVKTPEVQFEQIDRKAPIEKQAPAVKNAFPKTVAPPPQHKTHNKQKPGIIKRLFGLIFGKKPNHKHSKKPFKKKHVNTSGTKRHNQRNQGKYKQTRQGGTYRRNRRSQTRSFSDTPSSRQKPSNQRQKINAPSEKKPSVREQKPSAPVEKKPPVQEQKPISAVEKPPIHEQSVHQKQQVPAAEKEPKIDLTKISDIKQETKVAVKPRKFPKIKIDEPEGIVQVETKQKKTDEDAK